MGKFTFEEGVQADTLLLVARELLAEAEQVAAGKLVRIVHYPEGERPFMQLVPYRVAAYARRALGTSSVFPSEAKIAFTGRGVTVVCEPSEEGYFDFIRVMLAHSNALVRRHRREARQLRAKIRASEAKMQKGGATL